MTTSNAAWDAVLGQVRAEQANDRAEVDAKGRWFVAKHDGACLQCKAPLPSGTVVRWFPGRGSFCKACAESPDFVAPAVLPKLAPPEGARWLNSRYPGRCQKCGATFAAGHAALWFRGIGCLCQRCGESGCAGEAGRA